MPRDERGSSLVWPQNIPDLFCPASLRGRARQRDRCVGHKIMNTGTGHRAVSLPIDEASLGAFRWLRLDADQRPLQPRGCCAPGAVARLPRCPGCLPLRGLSELGCDRSSPRKSRRFARPLIAMRHECRVQKSWRSLCKAIDRYQGAMTDAVGCSDRHPGREKVPLVESSRPRRTWPEDIPVCQHRQGCKT